MSRVFRIMGWIENTVLFILIGLLFYLAIPLVGKKNIYLQQDSIGGIISQLRQKGYDVNTIDAHILQILGKPIPGWVYIGSKQTDRITFLYKLTSRREHFKVARLIPGETTYFFLRQLAKEFNKDVILLEESYRKLSQFPEGGILADTYHVPIHLSERGIVELLVNLTTKRYKKISGNYFDSWNPAEWERILTVASIIQKEAANKQEMPLIASVIYNRISKHMRLQMDGTLNYGKNSHLRVTPEMIKNDKSTYNTYKHKGLPSSPICNVSVAAIKAALNPEKSKYLYFMRNDKGTHDFSSTYKRHLRNVHERKSGLRNIGN